MELRALLLFLAHREGFKNFALRFRIFRNTAWRFVAGEHIDDAILVARGANGRRIRGSLDFLGESTTSREDAIKSVQEVQGMLDCIQSEKVDCNVSIKLTQLGLAIDREFCCQNLGNIVRHARQSGNFIRVDMEDSPYTAVTLELVLRTHEQMDNVGTVIQAYLYRSEADVRKLLEKGVRIRLCKGAYLEPEKIAFKKKRDTDANYMKLTKILLQSGIYHGIATHDPAIIQATKEFAAEKKIPKQSFEFQMLYGIRRDLQESLALDGYNVRIYIPYGTRWYPYFMRRLAERPANVMFIVRALLKG
jgi:proline dehydrogenase